MGGWRRGGKHAPSPSFPTLFIRTWCVGPAWEGGGREAIRAEEEEEASLPTGAGGDGNGGGGETLALDEGGGCGGGALSSSSSSMEEESLSLSIPPSVRPCCPPSSPFSPPPCWLTCSFVRVCVASRLPRGALTLNCASAAGRQSPGEEGRALAVFHGQGGAAAVDRERGEATQKKEATDSRQTSAAAAARERVRESF